ncbi:MAG: hydrogenase maturation protease [Pseudomonadota bacterium]
MLTIIGCGNTNRSDDAAGVVVAQRLIMALQDNPIDGVRVFDAGTSGMDTMFQARGSSALIIVDASLSESEPGSVFEVPGDELDKAYDASFSLHDFRWDHALHAGRKIFGDNYPDDVTVYLIEAQSTDLGLEQSEPVKHAVSKVVKMIWARIEALDA